MKTFILTFVFALLNLCVYSQDYSDRQIVELPDEVRLEIISFMDSLKGKGYHSCINIEYAYLDRAHEKGDYGPMYSGDTIQVKQFGILLSYKYDRPNTNKTKGIIHSDEWHSTHQVFFPDKGTKIWSHYFCRFGIPPTYGNSSRWVDLDEERNLLINFIRRKIKQ